MSANRGKEMAPKTSIPPSCLDAAGDFPGLPEEIQMCRLRGLKIMLVTRKAIRILDDMTERNVSPL